MDGCRDESGSSGDDGRFRIRSAHLVAAGSRMKISKLVESDVAEITIC